MKADPKIIEVVTEATEAVVTKTGDKAAEAAPKVVETTTKMVELIAENSPKVPLGKALLLSAAGGLVAAGVIVAVAKYRMKKKAALAEEVEGKTAKTIDPTVN